MFRVATRDRVVKFLSKKKSCFVSELCYLGKKQMQIKYPVVREIVDCLIAQKLVKIESIKLKKRILYKVTFRRS